MLFEEILVMGGLRFPPTFRIVLVLSGTAVAACVGVLILVCFWSLGVSQRLQERGDLARRQALLVTRIEADLAARMLAGGAQTRAEGAAMFDRLRVYRDMIEDERALIGDDAASRRYQHAEAETARRLAQLIAAASRRDAGPGALAEARGISHRIAVREDFEVQRAADGVANVRQRMRFVAVAVAMLVILALGLLGWWLWRSVIRPIDAVVAGTVRLAAECAPVRIIPGGIAELRELAMHFNDMAASIEAQVAQRTQQLAAANRDLAAIDARRRLFFSKVSHELRTPVTVMRGEAEIALRHDGGNAVALRDALGHVMANTLFLQRRIDDLLGLARAEDGALRLAMDRFDLATVVREAGDMAEPFARSSGVALMVDAADGTMPVLGDAEWVRQALVTIIDNGVKFSPPDGRVSLRLDRVDGQARIAISDQGPGVADADLDRIFDPYVQTMVGRRRGGTGLGLSLARWIADRHGGAVTAANGRQGEGRQGEGLCVSLMLPVVQ